MSVQVHTQYVISCDFCPRKLAESHDLNKAIHRALENCQVRITGEGHQLECFECGATRKNAEYMREAAKRREAISPPPAKEG